jgi:hypothetical protein
MVMSAQGALDVEAEMSGQADMVMSAQGALSITSELSGQADMVMSAQGNLVFGIAGLSQPLTMRSVLTALLPDGAIWHPLEEPDDYES